jgi:hypothetical protein
MIAGERPRGALALSALGALALVAGVLLPWYEDALAGRTPVSVVSHARGAPASLQAVLLALAGLALLDSLLGLGRAAGTAPAGAGASVAVLGLLAAACVAYRMAAPGLGAAAPSGALRAGAWLALVGSAAIVLGGLWPRVEPAASPAEGALRGAPAGLPGWLPGG